MSKITLFPILLICCLALFFPKNIAAQDFTDPVVYNDYIVDIQGKVLQQNVNYVMESVHNENYQQVEKSRLTLIESIKDALGKVQAMPAFDDETKFRDEAAAIFSLYLGAFQLEFKEANSLKAVRQESYEAMENYYSAQDKAERKLQAASERLRIAQNEFSTENNLIIMEGKGAASTQDVIKTINEVNTYSRAVFLAYFKVSKDDAATLDAMKEKQAKKMESYRKKLLISVDESLIKLKGLGAFKGDDAFRQSAMELLSFHKQIAQDGYTDIVKFISKEKEDLTQADVDRYNAVIELLNTRQNVLLGKFNEANAQFFKKHIPGGGIRM